MATRGLSANFAAAGPLAEPSTVNTPKAAFCIKVVTASLLPAPVSASIANGVPEGTFGQANVTCLGEANTTGVLIPFTTTVAPPSTAVWPEASEAVVLDS